MGSGDCALSLPATVSVLKTIIKGVLVWGTRP